MSTNAYNLKQLPLSTTFTAYSLQKVVILSTQKDFTCNLTVNCYIPEPTKSNFFV
jgi:hypothetical protein